MTMFPTNDPDFEEVTISEMSGDQTKGWSITRSDGWSFFVPASSPVVPKIGMSARFYGKGIGSIVRGLFLEGKRVFYRTQEEQVRHAHAEAYGVTAADWLRRWDEGGSCWSIEMGGLGPSYEQAIQLTSAEILRHMLATGYQSTKWDLREVWKVDREKIEAFGFSDESICSLGLSGAQWGAALSLASSIYRKGPLEIFTDKAFEKRHIQVSKDFPTLESKEAAWIPVGTELPDEEISVLVTQESGEVDPAYLDAGKWIFWGPEPLEVSSPVTHWMHFPRPATTA